MMELPHYLLLLARTSLSNLNLLSMEPPQSPKFNVPLWQPWVASPQKGTKHLFVCYYFYLLFVFIYGFSWCQLEISALTVVFRTSQLPI